MSGVADVLTVHRGHLARSDPDNPPVIVPPTPLGTPDNRHSKYSNHGPDPVAMALRRQ